MVPVARLELARSKGATDFKSVASAYSAIPAYLARPIVSRKLSLVVGFEPTKKL